MASWVLMRQVVAMVALLTGATPSLSTVFGSSRWDASNPRSRLACFHRDIDDRRDFVVAHNELPCGTPLLIYSPRTRRAVVARVADRGPLHADIDLSPRVAEQLRHNGREPVVVIPLDLAGIARPGTLPLRVLNRNDPAFPALVDDHSSIDAESGASPF
jgi:hypothetical protein